jgi:hypothetical protein
VPREEVHCRRIEMRGYRRADGMYDIEGRLVDTKPHPFALDGVPDIVAPGAHHQNMVVRIVVDEQAPPGEFFADAKHERSRAFLSKMLRQLAAAAQPVVRSLG